MHAMKLEPTNFAQPLCTLCEEREAVAFWKASGTIFACAECAVDLERLAREAQEVATQ